MLLPKCALLFGLILTLLLEPISGKRGFGGGHSYPRSGGLSGGGHRSGGLSGGGHGYPSSGGHAYPSSSGGSHAYPSSSGGSHAYPSSGGSHSYPSAGQSGGAHKYPPAGNNHGYPSAGGGLSGNGGGSHGYPGSKPAAGHTTNIHNHYHYSPPSQISYAAPHGGPPVSYPVYRGTPPNYVYQYKDSGSKYGTLLAGLALMNLGTLGVAAYAAHKASSGGSGSAPTYRAQPGEVCKFAVKKENGDYEETRIDCQIISSFILQDMQTQNTGTGTNSTITTTTTVTNVTMVNNSNAAADPTTTVAPAPGNVLYVMQANGTLVPINVTGINIPGLPGSEANETQTNETSTAVPNGGVSSITTTTTTTNTTLVSALDVKGKPVEVTPGMQCFVLRHSPTSNMKKTVPCGLLQSYADKSIQRSSASHNLPMFTIVAAILAYCVA